MRKRFAAVVSVLLAVSLLSGCITFVPRPRPASSSAYSYGGYSRLVGEDFTVVLENEAEYSWGTGLDMSVVYVTPSYSGAGLSDDKLGHDHLAYGHNTDITVEAYDDSYYDLFIYFWDMEEITATINNVVLTPDAWVVVTVDFEDGRAIAEVDYTDADTAAYWGWLDYPASGVNTPSASVPNGVVAPEVFNDPAYAPHAFTTEALRLRKGPGTGYDSIETIPQGTTVVELGYTPGLSEWLYVSVGYDGNKGWVASEYLEFPEGDMAKPVIYLYPTKTTDVEVKVLFTQGRFTCTYPEYNDGWKVTAEPDGRLVNKADGKEYSYLYWEGEGAAEYDMSRGFVVKGSDTAAFLQEKLTYMGLTPKEYNEFIVYWLPLMQQNPYNLITFQGAAYTDNVRLDVSPKPDSMLRIFMVYQPLQTSIAIPEQTLQPFARTGFSVIEWGGTQLEEGKWK